MELRHLRHFLTLAQIKNFGQAAKRLNLAQPSLSRSIARMESLLGVPLLERTSRGLVLTAFGELVQQRGGLIIDELDALVQEVEALRGDGRDTLVIGASPIPSNHLLGPVIGRFLSENPGVNVSLKVDSGPGLRQRLLEGELSCFIGESRLTGLDQDSDLVTVPLPPFRVLFCCRPGHPLAGMTAVRLEALHRFPVALPQDLPGAMGTAFETLLQAKCAGTGGVLRFDQFSSIRHSLPTCDLIALTPELSIADDLRRGELVLLSVVDLPLPNANYSLVYSKRQPLADHTSALIHCLQTWLVQGRILAAA